MSSEVVEYRICWAASSNTSFRGATDWEPAEDDAADAEDVESYFSGGVNNSEGLSIALEESGFEWWIETRIAGTDHA